MNKIYLLLISTFCAFLCSCQTLPERGPLEKNGKIYGVTEGAFRHNWWNYYERALSYADGGFLNEAELDLKDALKQRDKDQRRARTFGMHFVDYFPHRELGIVYYGQKRLSDALAELETSFDSVKNAKTELYLDRVRKAIIEEKKLDKLPPDIIIDATGVPSVTNSMSIEIKGLARDDTYVSGIKVGEKELPVKVSAKEIPFKIDIPLSPGANKIPVIVTDIAGKKTERFVNVRVDRLGPVLRIEEPVTIFEQTVSMKGVILDESGITALKINDKAIAHDGSREMPLDVNIELPGAGGELQVEATDVAGNVTKAAIPLLKVNTKLTVAPVMEEKGPDQVSPVIDVRDDQSERHTFLDYAYIEGHVKDNRLASSFSVNGEEILKKPGKSIYFSHLLPLVDGDNTLILKAKDRAGNETRKIIKIKKDVLNVRQTGSRLRVGVNDFKRQTIGLDQKLSYGLEDIITLMMKKRARFSLVERRNLADVISELQFNQSGLVEDDKALKIGKILSADAMLVGSVLERKNSLEIYSRLLDTETAEVIAEVDVYGEDIDIGVLRSLGQGVDLKLTEEMPVAEGIIVKVDGQRLILGLGSKAQIKNGMKVLVYQIGQPVRDPVTGKIIGTDVEELGEARIQSVMDDMSYAEVNKRKNNKVIAPKQSVITR